MKKVVVRGPLCTSSGYGVHCRSIARSLVGQSDVDVKFTLTQWGMTPWLIDKSIDDGLIGTIIDNSSTDVKDADVSLQVQLPNEWNPQLAKKNIGVTAGVESTVCNPLWAAACNKMDLVLVPSTFTRDVLKSAGNITTEIMVVPEPYHTACADDTASYDFKFSTSFNFLLFGQISGNVNLDRKNTINTLRWLCEQFHDDEDVGVVVKTNCGRNSCQDRQMTFELLETALKGFRKSKFPRVHLLHGAMSGKQIAALYKHPSVKALVSATRGEGFGLPILEASACALPVMVTNWSGHLDFVKHVKHVSFEHRLLPIDKQKIDNKIFMPGSKWAEVDEHDFKKKVHRFRNSPDVPKSWAVEGSKKILEMYSQDAIGKMYMEIVRNI